MYTVSSLVFIQHLNGLRTILDKATVWAAARKVNEADLLNMRLSPDIFNLARQVRRRRDLTSGRVDECERAILRIYAS